MEPHTHIGKQRKFSPGYHGRLAVLLVGMYVHCITKMTVTESPSLMAILHI